MLTRRPRLHSPRQVAAAFATLMLSAAIGAATEQGATSPRLRDGRVPAQPPQAFGGGEVVLELTVDSDGRVARIDRVRVTPPYAEHVVNAAARWRFTPATAVIDGRATTVDASVLVVAIFRPPSLYAGPAPGAPPRVVGTPSPRLPSVGSVAPPAYPPTVTGDGVVVVEIEMSREAKPRNYRIVGPASGFDHAALDAVRSWRFGAPLAPEIADPLFAYAVVGFRAPVIGPATRPD